LTSTSSTKASYQASGCSYIRFIKVEAQNS